MSTTTLPSAMEAARQTLDAWVREVIEWHFDPATGCPFWLDWAAKAGWDPRREVHAYDDLDKFGGFEDEWLRGGPGAQVGAERLRRQARLHLRNRRQHRRAQGAHQHRRLPHRLRELQQDAARRGVSERRRLDLDRPQRSAAAAPGGRAPLPASRRHLLRRGPRSALGDQAAEAQRLRRGGALQAARRRSGADVDEGAREHQVHLHDAEAARGAVRTGVAQEARHHRRLLRRHRDDAAVPPLRRRGTARRHLLRADLRQHADGAGDAQAADRRTTTGRSSTSRRRRAR